ncbi:spike base protein, RCAP_Rcc01079 family [Pelagibacterium xiamenense]|uniref:spike base protein, RCAP_Rcc01079 family n=1 Tax=Pelagibacterium xiamenense TaxID=2901140 RepID=UPI001E4D5A59|nr:hypothetical protein [Pelagibacterium xiamenense]MCD7059664.1 hypothetical protein [Pelagibacterium xiamenense]
MSTTFPGRTASMSGPAGDVFTITPDDAVDLAQTTRAIYVGVTGDLAVVAASGAQATFAGVPGGTVLPLRVARVLASGTSAGSLVGLV